MKNTVKKLMLVAVVFASQANCMELKNLAPTDMLKNLGQGIVYYAQRHVGEKAEKLFFDLDMQEAGLAMLKPIPSGPWLLKPWYWYKRKRLEYDKKSLEYARNNALSAIEDFTRLRYEDSPELTLLKNHIISQLQLNKTIRALVARRENLPYVF